MKTEKKLNAVEFEICGPYEIKVVSKPGGSIITNEQIATFWADKRVSRHRNEKGCYVFAMRVTNGDLPFYVGKATKKFETEIFQHHKLTRYYEAMAEYANTHSAYFLFLIPAKRKGKTNKRAIDQLEKDLIARAYEKNEQLKNTNKLPKPNPWVINGINKRLPTPGQPSKEVTTLKTLLGIA